MNLPICIVGGGPAGSMCALQLARSGFDLVLAERTMEFERGVGEICGPNVRHLVEGACFRTPEPGTYVPLPHFYSAWGSDEIEVRDFRFWQTADAMALDRPAFDSWFLRLVGDEGVNVLRGCAVKGAQWNSDRWVVQMQTGSTVLEIEASFLVEASGRAARSAAQPGAKRYYTDKLVCMAVNLDFESGADEPMALIESSRNGWWYSAPVPGKRRVACFFTDSDLVGPSDRRREFLTAALDETVHSRRLIAEIPQGARIDVSDARSSVRQIVWRDSWVSIGDAAFSLDPLSGGGIESAIRDGIESASAIAHALTEGNFAPLRTFASEKGATFQRSLDLQRSYYEVERRFMDSLFWGRRA